MNLGPGKKRRITPEGEPLRTKVEADNFQEEEEAVSFVENQGDLEQEKAKKSYLKLQFPLYDYLWVRKTDEEGSLAKTKYYIIGKL